MLKNSARITKTYSLVAWKIYEMSRKLTIFEFFEKVPLLLSCSNRLVKDAQPRSSMLPVIHSNAGAAPRWLSILGLSCFLMLPPPSLIAQTGCSGGASAYCTLRLLARGPDGFAANDLTVQFGDTLFYQVTVGVPPDGSCPLTNVNALLKIADGTVVQCLSNASVGQGVSITCPGNPLCINTNLLKCVVRREDIGKDFFLSQPNALPGWGTNVCFFPPMAHRVGAILNLVGVSVGDTSISAASACSGISAFVPVPITLIGAGLDGTNFVFSFETLSNHTYTVEWTDSWSSPNWQTFTNLVGNGSLITVRDSAGHPRRFYRVFSH